MTKKLGDTFYFLENIIDTDLRDSHFSTEKLEQIKNQVAAIEDYKEKLMALFSHSIELVVSKVMRSPGEEILIDISPRSPAQIEIYNSTVREFLHTVRGNDEFPNYKNRYRTCDDFIKNFDERRNNGIVDEIIATEIDEIQEVYPNDFEFKKKKYLDFMDSPYERTQTTGRVEVFNYLEAGRQIDFKSKFISTRHHIIILQCEEVLKYKKFLKEQKQRLEKHHYLLPMQNENQDSQFQTLKKQLGKVHINVNKLTEIITNNVAMINSELNSEHNNGKMAPDPQAEIEIIKGSKSLQWKELPMDVVTEHFLLMTKKENKNGEPFLTETQLISFLRKGFLNETAQPKQKINCAAGEKGFVILRFYNFFALAVADYSYLNHKKEFIKLFTDCFDNWEPSTIPAYFKPNKVKGKW